MSTIILHFYYIYSSKTIHVICVILVIYFMILINAYEPHHSIYNIAVVNKKKKVSDKYSSCKARTSSFFKVMNVEKFISTVDS